MVHHIIDFVLFPDFRTVRVETVNNSACSWRQTSKYFDFNYCQINLKDFWIVFSTSWAWVSLNIRYTKRLAHFKMNQCLTENSLNKVTKTKRILIVSHLLSKVLSMMTLFISCLKKLDLVWCWVWSEFNKYDPHCLSLLSSHKLCSFDER